VINRLDAAALSTIRGTGGNNAKRLVMLPGYSANNDSRMSKLVVPSDAMVAVSVHSYDPQSFCMSYASTNVSTFTDTKFVQDMFDLVANTFVKKNIPVILGEWAATNKNNLSERVKHAKFFAQKGKAARIPIILWDNGNTKVDPDGMGFLDRSKPAWAFPDIIKAIVAEYPSAVAPAAKAIAYDLRVTQAKDGLRFTAPETCDRFVLTGIDGRSTVLPGGKTGFVATGTVRSGVYALRAEGVGGVATRTVLVE
jgi:aryl-phospho-beta-D-glucosidase BglC (GH1 family)